MKEYLEIGIKLAIGLVTLIFQMNLLGKGNLAPTSSLDQLQNFVLGGIIGGMIYNNQISILQYLLQFHFQLKHPFDSLALASS